MKNFMNKALGVLAVCLVAVSFTSCENDNNGPKKPEFKSDLIGSYAPYITSEPEDAVLTADIFINPTWPDPENIPTIDMSFLAGEGMTWPVDLVVNMAGAVLTGLYAGGLDSFEFKNDGSFAFKYRKIEDFMNMQFSQQAYVFPDAETEKLIPAGVLGYYTENGKVYFKVNKAFISQIGKDKLGMDLTPVIDGMIESYELQGSVVSTEEYFALPLKYTKKDGKLTILIDRDMIMPFMPLIELLVTSMVPESMEADLFGTGEPMIIPARKLLTELLDGLFKKSATFEIGIVLKY